MSQGSFILVVMIICAGAGSFQSKIGMLNNYKGGEFRTTATSKHKEHCAALKVVNDRSKAAYVYEPH